MAILDYGEAIRLEPQNAADSYHNRGTVYGNLGQYEQAIKDYDQAIRLDPEYAPAYANRALAYALSGDDTAALEDVDQAVRIGIEGSEELERANREIIDQR